jgi:AAA family ATP:ADP antiporter
MTHPSNLTSFNAFRRLIFPIYSFEMSLFLPMALMMLFAVFNYTILGNLKDTLIVNAPGSDATVISFLKMWGTTPAAITYMLIYTKWVERFGRERMVYYSLTALLIYFILFGCILFPYHSFMHPSLDTIQALQKQWPHFKWWLAIGGNWSYALFFIVSELCGTLSLALFFWQFANAICDKAQAKRFYPLFGLIGNFGLIIAGYLLHQLSNPTLNLKNSFLGALWATDAWGITVRLMLFSVSCSLVIIQVIYYQLNRHLEKKPLIALRLAETKVKGKNKGSLIQSLHHILSSKHLACIAILVLAYGLTINYCDVLWKSELRTYFKSDPLGYSRFMGGFSITIGLLTIPLMLISSHLLRSLSWLSAAILTPLIMLIAGGGFFIGILWGLWQAPEKAFFHLIGYQITPLTLAVYFGYWQNALSKASKYSLFDPTKEMAYIPLDEEVKTKGKAAVEIVGSRFGKTGGSLTFFLLQTLLPQLSLQQITPFIFAIFLIVLLLWFRSLMTLHRVLKDDPEPKGS